MKKWTVLTSPPRTVTVTLRECGCTLEINEGDHVKVWICEHGRGFVGREEPTGQRILEYERWLRTPEAREYFASMSSYDGGSGTLCHLA